MWLLQGCQANCLQIQALSMISLMVTRDEALKFSLLCRMSQIVTPCTNACTLCYHSNGRAVRVNTNLCDPSLQTTHDRVGCSPHFFLHLSYSLQNRGLTTFLFIPYANFICFPSLQSYDIICIYEKKNLYLYYVEVPARNHLYLVKWSLWHI